MSMIENLEAMLASGKDNGLLRFTLGGEYFKAGDMTVAARHLQEAVKLDPGYSAAWKIYGKVLQSQGDPGAARKAFEAGIEAAKQKGDVQAAKEMAVFLRRVQKELDASS